MTTKTITFDAVRAGFARKNVVIDGQIAGQIYRISAPRAKRSLWAADDRLRARYCELSDSLGYQALCAAVRAVVRGETPKGRLSRSCYGPLSAAPAPDPHATAGDGPDAASAAEAKAIPLLLAAQDGYDVDWPETFQSTGYSLEHVRMVTFAETLEPNWDADTTDERIRQEIEEWSDNEGLREQALEWALETVADCRAARDLGRKALAEYRAGRFAAAYEAAKDASLVEAEYGDDPLYGPVQHELAAYGSDEYEVQEFWPPRDGQPERAGDIWPRAVFAGSPDEALDVAIGGGLKAADYAAEPIVVDLLADREIVLAVWRLDRTGERAGEEAGRRTTTLR